MRYRLLAPHAAKLPQLFVPFRYVDGGIKVGSSWYPVVAMQWATGTPLGQWVEQNLSAPDKLRRLCGVLSGVLAELEAAQMAHGDWQHDNLLVSPSGDSVTLVDYDGLFVPELAGTPSPENGHPNYQHPARTSAHFGPGLDRFACLVLQTGLLALSHKPALWARFSDGESVLFQKGDFLDPSRSQAFHAVRAVAEESGDETLADTIARLEDACRSGAGETLLPAIAPVELPLPPVPAIVAGQDVVPVSQQPVNGKSAATTWWEAQAAVGGTSGAGAAGRWWQAANAASLGAASAGTRNTTMAAGTATGETFAYLERAFSEETLAVEAREINQARFAAGFIVFLVLLIFSFVSPIMRFAFGRGNMFAVLMPIGLVYTFLKEMVKNNTARKRIYEELVAEIEKMEALAKARLDKVLTTYGGNKPVSTVGGATVGEYVADRLRQTNARAIVSDNRFQASTLRLLREAGIETLLDLQRRTQVPKVPPHTLHALQQWLREVESDFAAQYRKNGGMAASTAPPAQTPQEAARLRDEAREFQREAARLKRERDLFPNVSYGAYLRKLAGLPEAPAKGKMNVP